MLDKYYEISVSRKMTSKGVDALLLTTTLALQYLAKTTVRGSRLVTPQLVACYLYGDTAKSKVTDIEKIFKQLDCVSSCSGGYYYTINEDAFPKLENNFVLIAAEELEVFFNCGRRNMPQLLQHYIRIIKSLDYTIVVNGRSNVVGHMAADYFMQEYGLSRNTITNYNNALIEMGLLYIHRAPHETNVYGRACNKVIIDDYALSISGGNFRRQVSARYNAYIKNPAAYCDEQVQQLYEDCVKYNSISSDNKKDLSVFT